MTLTKMLKLQDFFFFIFFNKSILIEKLNLKNYFSIPKLKTITLFFFLTEINTIDLNNRIISAFFLLRVLSKKKPYIFKLNVFQTFKKKKITIFIKVDLQNETFYMFQFINLFLKKFLINTINNVKIKNVFLKNNNLILEYKFFNLDFFKLVETHFIFFKWKDFLYIKFLFSFKNFYLNFSKVIEFYKL